MRSCARSSDATANATRQTHSMPSVLCRAHRSSATRTRYKAHTRSRLPNSLGCDPGGRTRHISSTARARAPRRAARTRYNRRTHTTRQQRGVVHTSNKCRCWGQSTTTGGCHATGQTHAASPLPRMSCCQQGGETRAANACTTPTRRVHQRIFGTLCARRVPRHADSTQRESMPLAADLSAAAAHTLCWV